MKISSFFAKHFAILLTFSTFAFFIANLVAVFDADLKINNFANIYTSIKDEASFAPSTMISLDSSTEVQNKGRSFVKNYYKNIDKSLLGTKYDSISFPYLLLNTDNGNGVCILDNGDSQKSVISTALYQPQKTIQAGKELYFMAGTKIRTHNDNKSVSMFADPGKATFITDVYANKIISQNSAYSSFDDILEKGYSFFAYSNTNTYLYGSISENKKYTVANIVYTQSDGDYYGYDGYDLFRTNGDFLITSDILLYSGDSIIDGLMLATNIDYNEFSNKLVLSVLFHEFDTTNYNYLFNAGDSSEQTDKLSKSFDLFIKRDIVKMANASCASVFGVSSLLLLFFLVKKHNSSDKPTNIDIIICSAGAIFLVFLTAQITTLIFGIYIFGFASLLIAVFSQIACGILAISLYRKT
jgi:hypothetical protein